MGSTAKNLKNVPNNETQLKLLYGENSLTKYWTSSLFNSVYLQHEIAKKQKRWNDDENIGFQSFMNELRNISVDYKNRERELESWSETETINNLVKRILGALGWENNCTGRLNPYLEETTFRYENKSYRTDILIVNHPNEKMYVKDADGDKRIQAARKSVLIPVEVKYWQRLEEYRQGQKEEKRKVDTKFDDISRTTTPNDQTVQYMEVLNKKWGILTDGAKWRLFNSELSNEDSERYFEFNFQYLFEAMTTEETEADSREIIDAAKYFYHFFSKSALTADDSNTTIFADQILNLSRKYVNKVEEDLKNRFVKAMNIACNGLLKSSKKNGENVDQATLRNISESALFNILFIKSLESRNILPMTATDYKKISLSSIIDKIEKFDPEQENLLNLSELKKAFKQGNGNAFDFTFSGTELHDRIIRLTGVIHKGASTKDNFGFEICGFKESIFTSTEWNVFKNSKITNQEWVEIIFQLGYADSDSLDYKYQQIPYSYFTPRQLGSIYESFLEFQIKESESTLVYDESTWVKPSKSHSKKLPKVEKGELYFSPNNIDKKASGSFYTPDPIVQFVTKETLSSLVENKKPNEILKIRVCDPAMGSGHFLSFALSYLTYAYLKSSNIDNNEADDVTVSEAKHKVLSNCIFGIDLNPRAVKLAKLSLWLSSATVGSTLENLDDQLFHGDALISNLPSYKDSFDWSKEIFKGKEIASFDCIIGNPPWGANIDRFSDYFHKLYEPVIGSYLEVYKLFVAIGLEKLNDNGILGFIVPNTFIAQPRYEDLRSYLLEKKSIYKIINLGDNVFEGVVAPSAIIIAGKQKAEKYQYANLAINNNYSGELSSIDWEEVNTDSILETSDRSLIQQRKMKNNEFLAGEVLEIKDAGIQYHRSGIGLKNKGGNDLYERLFKESSKSFKKSEPVWYGKLINDYYMSDRTDEFFNKEYKNTLKKNETVSFSEKSFNEKEKIVWRQTAPYIKGTIDKKQRWFRNTIQCCWIKEDYKSKVDLYYILGVLNSSYLRMIYCSIVNEAAGKVFPQVKLTHVKKLPIRVPDKAIQVKIKKLVEKLISDGIEIPNAEVVSKIDTLVCEIYDVKGQDLKNLMNFNNQKKTSKKTA